MQLSIYNLLISYLTPIIYVVGFVVCFAGYRKIKRKVYLYATFFFAVNILQLWQRPFAHYYAYPYSETFWTVSGYINLVFMFLFLIAMGLLVWGFYLEAEVNKS
jgi:hypothetical protein